MSDIYASRLYRTLSACWRLPFYALLMLFTYISNRQSHQIESPPSQKPLGPCRYRLDTATSSTLTLPDGRKIGYAEFGLPTGKPVICLHGIPGSRLEHCFWHDAALKHGLRLIGIDRPGLGWSSPVPGRTVMDHATQDVAKVVEHLGLNEKGYGVLGVSGGGPYALACAEALSADRLKVVTLICGLGPPDIGYWGMFFLNYLGWTWANPYFPNMIRLYQSRDPGAQVHLSDEERLRILQEKIAKGKDKIHEKEVEFLNDVDILRLSLRSHREAFANGLDGFVHDGKVLSTDSSSYKVENIRKDLPVMLWYGTEDYNVPMNHGVQIAKRLGGNARLHIQHETHMSLEMNCVGRILEEMAEFL